jgi:hypothetical protein
VPEQKPLKQNDPIDPAVRDWCDRYASALGVASPTDAEIDALLNTAGVAAHASARQAAPITCWLAAQAGIEADAALDAARRVAGLA